MDITPLKLAVMITLAVIAVGLIVFDVFLATNSEKGDTISELIAYYSMRSLLIPAVFGILIGHFWWANAWWDQPGWLTLSVLSTLALMWLGFDIHMIATKGQVVASGFIGFMHKFPIVNVAIHTVVGWLIWGQNILNR